MKAVAEIAQVGHVVGDVFGAQVGRNLVLAHIFQKSHVRVPAVFALPFDSRPELRVFNGKHIAVPREVAREYARDDGVGDGPARDEVGQPEHHRYLLACRSLVVADGLEDVGMATDDQVDVHVGQELGVFKLLGIGLGRVFRAPVHVHDYGVGYRPRAFDFALHDVLVELAGVVLVGEVLGIGAVEVVHERIAQERNAGAVALDHAHGVAVVLRGVTAHQGNLRILREQALRALDAVFALVPGMVRVEVDNVEARVGNCRNRRIGRVEHGIARVDVAVLVARAGGFLVDEAQVVLTKRFRSALVVWCEVIRIVADATGVGVQNGEVHARGEDVANGSERDGLLVDRRDTVPENQVVHAVG